MYSSAPINQLIKSKVKIENEKSTVNIDVNPDFFHAGQALHGSLYFKALDDSAFFAVNSIVDDVFVLTTSFTTYLTRPVSKGILRAEGKLVYYNKSQFIAESVLYDDQDREIGRGNGMFVKGKMKLEDVPGYKL